MAGEPEVLETTWHVGVNTQPEPKGRVLGSAGTSCFQHRARVWKGPDGKVVGEWYETAPGRRGWWRFLGERIPAALYEQAVEERAKIRVDK
jgi:hypothetical protein